MNIYNKYNQKYGEIIHLFFGVSDLTVKDKYHLSYITDTPIKPKKEEVLKNDRKWSLSTVHQILNAVQNSLNNK